MKFIGEKNNFKLQRVNYDWDDGLFEEFYIINKFNFYVYMDTYTYEKHVHVYRRTHSDEDTIRNTRHEKTNKVHSRICRL